MLGFLSLQLQSLGPKKVAFLWSHFKAATVAEMRTPLTFCRSMLEGPTDQSRNSEFGSVLAVTHHCAVIG